MHCSGRLHQGFSLGAFQLFPNVSAHKQASWGYSSKIPGENPRLSGKGISVIQQRMDMYMWSNQSWIGKLVTSFSYLVCHLWAFDGKGRATRSDVHVFL